MDGLKDLLVGLKHLQLRIAENITSKVKHLHTVNLHVTFCDTTDLHLSLDVKYYKLSACT